MKKAEFGHQTHLRWRKIVYIWYFKGDFCSAVSCHYSRTWPRFYWYMSFCSHWYPYRIVLIKLFPATWIHFDLFCEAAFAVRICHLSLSVSIGMYLYVTPGQNLDGKGTGRWGRGGRGRGSHSSHRGRLITLLSGGSDIERLQQEPVARGWREMC